MGQSFLTFFKTRQRLLAVLGGLEFTDRRKFTDLILCGGRNLSWTTPNINTEMLFNYFLESFLPSGLALPNAAADAVHLRFKCRRAALALDEPSKLLVASSGQCPKESRRLTVLTRPAASRGPS